MPPVPAPPVPVVVPDSPPAPVAALESPPLPESFEPPAPLELPPLPELVAPLVVDAAAPPLPLLVDAAAVALLSPVELVPVSPSPSSPPQATRVVTNATGRARVQRAVPCLRAEPYGMAG